MARERIILDCDPGVDDAVAILLALAAPDEIELTAITTVAGNVPLAKTEANARRVCSLVGRRDIAIHAGCARPIMPGKPRRASVHGTDGLGDVGVPAATFELRPEHAVDVLIDRISAAPGEITLCPIGPMTNIAVALVKEPSIAEKIRRIVFMGGAAFRPGNVTPEAEFNVWVDPHAADIVLAAGIPTVMIGMDVTQKARITPERVAALRSLGGRPMEMVAAMLASYAAGDLFLHDACVIAYLMDETLFSGIDAYVRVDCQDGLCHGRTVAAVSERDRAGMAANCHVVTKVDEERLFALLTERLKRFA